MYNLTMIIPVSIMLIIGLRFTNPVTKLMVEHFNNVRVFIREERNVNKGLQNMVNPKFLLQ